jgi:predicted nucleic acid-binding Zn ribbon protein
VTPPRGASPPGRGPDRDKRRDTEERYWPKRGKRLSRGNVPGETRDPIEMAEALDAVGDDLGMAGAGALGMLTQRWPEVVGDAIAEHAELRALRDGVLTIAVDGPEWATQLRYLGDDVRARVTDLVGADLVREVRVVVVPPAR